ncbi:hypothetical protein AB1285_18900 [Microbacterium sp. NRRL B-14842]|uniref:hypothetical protein n=1 Tax=Microbacterium sp. NRRL B-14842 TaxID=3162881 RepID=UPI003D2D1A27
MLAVMAIAGGIAVYVVFRRRRPGLTAPEQGRPMPREPAGTDRVTTAPAPMEL